MNFLSKAMKKAVAFALPVFGSALAFAEGEAGNGGAIDVNTVMSGWVSSAQTTMSNWGTTLAPLFTLGIGLVLLVIAWRLFKRTTKSAT